jgi:hypothetical protein
MFPYFSRFYRTYRGAIHLIVFGYNFMKAPIISNFNNIRFFKFCHSMKTSFRFKMFIKSINALALSR